VYDVYLERSAERDLKKLPADLFQKLIFHIKALAVDPRPPGSRKIRSSINDWRIRVGDHRIIYEIDEKAKTVMVLKVKFRKEAYR
jgi:mRNA interferase RelE/StbE